MMGRRAWLVLLLCVSSVASAQDFQRLLHSTAALLNEGKLKEAEVQARRLIETAPRSPIGYNLLGVIYDRSGKLQEAEASYQKALHLDAKFVGAANNLGNLYARQGRAEDAISAFRRVLELQPDHPQANFNLGSLLAARGDFGQASEFFGRALRAGGNDPGVQLAFIKTALLAGKQQDALDAASQLQRTGHGSQQVLFSLGLLLAESGQYDRAIPLFQRVSELRPKTL